MGALRQRLRGALRSYFFSYETPKVIEIESRFIGVLYKLLQLVLFAVVIVWIFILNNGYQFIDNGAVGGTTNKIKGIAYSNSSDVRVGKRVWDSADLHVPPQDDGAFFLTTNVIITHNQSQGVCGSLAETRDARCTSDADCLPVGKPYHLGHGVSTGVCNLESNTCMVEAWCPIEDDYYAEGRKTAQLRHVSGFTVFIKNHVHFPHYNITRSNLIEGINKTTLRSCRYHPIDDPYCPIFRIGDIVSLAETKYTNQDEVTLSDSWFEALAIKGGVVSITIKWDCDFDYQESKCKPDYRFTRLDNYKGNDIAKGFNFRYPLYFVEDGQQKRQLIKAFGVLFLFETEATARAFDLTTFLLNVGSGLALLGIAEVFAEIVLLYLHRNRKLFQKIKAEHQPRIKKNSQYMHEPTEVCLTTETSESDNEKQRSEPGDSEEEKLDNSDKYREDSNNA